MLTVALGVVLRTSPLRRAEMCIRLLGGQGKRTTLRAVSSRALSASRPRPMARSPLRLALVALLLLALSPARAANTRSILDRYNVNATNVLGLRLNRLMQRISEFQLPTSQVTSIGPSKGPTNGPPKDTRNVPVYEVIPVDPPGGAADSSIIVLHGLDSRPEDLLIISTIARTWLPRTRFVMPRAPVADVTYLGRRATSWFDVFERTPGRENVPQLRAAAAGVARLVAEEQRVHKIPSERVIVLGMSQGGAVALTLYLAEEVKVGGVIGAATWLPIPKFWNKSNLAAANARTNLLMLHGERDAVIPFAEATQSMQMVRNLGRNVRYITYPRGGHTLAEEITKVAMDIIAFVKIQLGKV